MYDSFQQKCLDLPNLALMSTLSPDFLPGFRPLFPDSLRSGPSWKIFLMKLKMQLSFKNAILITVIETTDKRFEASINRCRFRYRDIFYILIMAIAIANCQLMIFLEKVLFNLWIYCKSCERTYEHDSKAISNDF